MRTKRFVAGWIAFVLLCSLGARAQSYVEWVDSAYACIGRDSLAQAELCLKRAVETEPAGRSNAVLFSALGQLQRRQGKLAEAVQSYSLALNYSSLNVPVLLSRAAAYMELGDEERAYVDYCNVLDQDADQQEALMLRAYIAVHKHAYDVARADYTRLLGADAGNAEALFGLALLNQKQHRLREATEQLSDLIRRFPGNETYLLARADVLAERGQHDLALIDQEEAIRCAPDDAFAYVSRAETLLQMKRKKEARKDLDRAVALGLPRAELEDMYKRSR